MEDVYSSIRPFYILLKILGVFPITSTEKQSSWGNFANVLIASCSIIIFILVFFANILRRITFFSVYSTEIIQLIWLISLYFYIASTFVETCYQIYKRNEIKNFLKLLNKFDTKVNTLNFSLKIY